MGNLLGLLAGLGWGYSDYYGGKASRRINHLLFFTYTQIFSLIPLFLLLLFIPSVFTLSAFGWGMLAGLGNLAGMLLFFAAVRIERLSIVLPTSGVFAAIIPVLYAIIVRNEQLPSIVMLGILLSIVGVVLVSSSTSSEFAPEHSSSTHHLTGVAISVAAGICWGIVYLAIGAASDDSGMWPLIASRTCVILAFGIAFVQRVSMRITRDEAKTSIHWMIFGTGSFVLFRLGVNHGNLAVISVLATASPVYTAMLAWFIDKEHATQSQVMGVIIAGIGIALLNT